MEEQQGLPLRLVRCPKCQNLLPELPEYSVYQCGGCGAVLRGKQSTPANGKRLLDKSDDENGTRVEPSTKEHVSLESKREESDEFEVGRRQGRIIHEKVANLTPSTSSRKEKRQVITDSDKTRRRRLDFGPIRSSPVEVTRNASTAEKGKFGNLPSSNEGPSSSNLSRFNSFGDHITDNCGQDLENDRIELLKKLDELRTQLSRSCNVAETPYHLPHQPPPLPHQHHLPRHQYLPPTYHDPFYSYNQHETLLHRPSCSCSQCYNINWQLIPPKVRPFSSFTSPRQLPGHHVGSLDLGNDYIGRRYLKRRVILTHGGEHVSSPISGGAPFISCYNCFELLIIPKTVTFLGKNNQKTIKCAVCSSLILLTLEDNKIVASFSSPTIQQKVNKRRSNRSLYNSVDYDKNVYKFLPVPILESQDDELTESQRTNQERVTFDHNMKKSLEDASMATEIDVSLTEYLNSDVSKEDDQSRSKKEGSESFFAGLIKKRLKDFSRTSSRVEKGRSDVFVNGQLLTESAVKKAQKLAGPIHPGEYWYDSLAGFWGVMNQPCLGIIPPFIEEFDRPMPKNCAAGNTGVFVNGRELNQKDLDLLAGRGLPIAKDRSYIIDISGKVVDEDTGQELDALGKLAPTVERVKHGFGMKVPKAVAK